MMISLMFALMLVADPAATTAETAAAAEVQKPEKAKKVCREDMRTTGSRMKKKVCLTEAEWAKRDAGKSTGDLKTIGGR